MQITDKAEQRSQLDDFQGLIVIEKSPRGRRLKQPITVEIPKNLSEGEKAVRRYVIDAFSWKMAELIHFTFRYETVLKLATRLSIAPLEAKQHYTSTHMESTPSSNGWAEIPILLFENVLKKDQPKK